MGTVLITGASGFIGRALCAAMRQKGWHVKGTVRSEGAMDTLPSGVEGILIQDLAEDYGSYSRYLEGVDAVVHLAARVHILNEDAADPLDAFRRVNVRAASALAEASARAGVRTFIFMSSIKVNGEGSEQPYSEDSAPAPRDAYGISKWEAEQALAGIAGQTGLRTVILRPPLVYGPGVKANFHELIQLVRKGFPLPFKGINNRRSFIYIGNLIDAVMKCLADEKACGHTFMVSDGQDVSTPALIEMIARAMGTKAVLFAVPSVFLKAAAHAAGKGDAMERLLGSLWADTGKIRNILGWKPPCELETGLRETMKAEKS